MHEGNDTQKQENGFQEALLSVVPRVIGLAILIVVVVGVSVLLMVLYNLENHTSRSAQLITGVVVLLGIPIVVYKCYTWIMKPRKSKNP
jgi:UDP-N-acetylmuramyl pentapeptide phosphotransferase/UDP-N-acetylglucosamine-1-phosphate transferase